VYLGLEMKRTAVTLTPLCFLSCICLDVVVVVPRCFPQHDSPAVWTCTGSRRGTVSGDAALSVSMRAVLSPRLGSGSKADGGVGGGGKAGGEAARELRRSHSDSALHVHSWTMNEVVVLAPAAAPAVVAVSRPVSSVAKRSRALSIAIARPVAASEPNVPSPLAARGELSVPEDEVAMPAKSPRQMAGLGFRHTTPGLVVERTRFRQAVKAGTVDALIGRCVDPTTVADRDFVADFVVTHRVFVATADLVRDLFGRFRAADDMVRLLVIHLLKKLIEYDPEAFTADPDTHAVFDEFVDFTRMQAAALAALAGGDEQGSEGGEGATVDWGEHLTLVLAEQSARLATSTADNLEAREGAPRPFLPSNLGSAAPTFLDLHPTEIARQLTLYDHARLRAVRVSSLLGKDPSKDASLQALIARFNKVSFWIAGAIVSEAVVSRRRLVMERVVQLAGALLALNNFKSLMAVYSALNLGPVSRLKLTRAGLSDEVVAVQAEVEAAMSGAKNFAAYRARLAALPADAPVVPCTPILIQDLTFLAENPDFTEDPGVRMVNWSKMMLLSKVVHIIRRAQGKEFALDHVPLINDFIVDIDEYSEDELWTLSKRNEPRAAATTDTLTKGSKFATLRSSMTPRR